MTGKAWKFWIGSWSLMGMGGGYLGEVATCGGLTVHWLSNFSDNYALRSQLCNRVLIYIISR